MSDRLLGAQQLAILRTVHGGNWFDCSDDNAMYRACMRLEARHLVARDLKSRFRFTSTAAGDALIEAHDADVPSLLPPTCEGTSQ